MAIFTLNNRNSQSSLYQFDYTLTNLTQTTNRKYHEGQNLRQKTIPEAYLVESIRWRVLSFVFSELLVHEVNRSRDKVIIRHIARTLCSVVVAQF